MYFYDLDWPMLFTVIINKNHKVYLFFDNVNLIRNTWTANKLLLLLLSLLLLLLLISR